MLIGISGRKQSGKTTTMNFLHGYLMKKHGIVDKFEISKTGDLVVNALYHDANGIPYSRMGVLDLKQTGYEFLRFAHDRIWPIVKGYNFGDYLKEICMNLFDLSYEQCYGTNEQKDSPSTIKWSDMPDVLILDELEVKKLDKFPNIKEKFYVRTSDRLMSGREVLEYYGSKICRKIKGKCWVDNTLEQIDIEQPYNAIIGDVRFVDEVIEIQKRGGIVIRLLRDPFASRAEAETDLDNYNQFDCIIEDQPIEEVNKIVEKFIKDKVV